MELVASSPLCLMWTILRHDFPKEAQRERAPAVHGGNLFKLQACIVSLYLSAPGVHSFSLASFSLNKLSSGKLSSQHPLHAGNPS